MNEGISIIIPLYNKEKDIYKCLDSILLQSYIAFEVLIIDDGSFDNSAKICLDFCSRDDRFKYYKKINGGVSSARNYGLNKAKYEYIVFIDADDYVEKKYLESLINNKSDLVVEGFKTKENGIISEYHIFNNKYNKDEILKLLMQKEITNIFSVPYLKLYRMKYIKENNIKFNEKLNFGEDFDFVLKYLDVITGEITLVDKCYYINRIEDGSLSRKDVSNIWEQLITIYASIKKIYINNEDALSFYLIRFAKISLLNSYCIKFHNFKKIFNEIRNDNNFQRIDSKKLKHFSVDRLIHFLIKRKIILIGYLLFYFKRRK